ncbi:helix-turn-helix domain-containing protein [Algoriphagus resistens]|uniref:helix-turn-helix domain-containing protein n=1 Tax=Algoriphagus resistens TaxID=1750590 RepID=UPI000716BF3A|nr:AraC family transcriptional regulator [Algoriphagus resistens]
MNLHLSLINILILFGAIQGLIFSVVLFTSKRHPGTFYLGLVIVAMVYNGLETFNWSSGLEDYFSFFDFYPFVTIFLLGPSFYLYFNALYLRDTQVSKAKKALFFTPFFFQLLVLTIGWIATLFNLLRIFDMRHWLEWTMNLYLSYSEPWSLLFFLIFTGLALRDFSGDQEERRTDRKTVLRSREIRSWVKKLLVFQTLLGVLWTATLLVPYVLEWPYNWSYYYPVEIFLVIFLYWIAIVGYSKLKTIHFPEPNLMPSTEISQNGESAKSLRLITHAMEVDKLYLNPELSLAILASHTGIAPKLISLTLNQQARSNFNDFVNSFRVEAFCTEIQKEENSKLTLIGLASQCGFNSPATFQRTFKKMKGVTPKVFANRLKLSQNN